MSNGTVKVAAEEMAEDINIVEGINGSIFAEDNQTELCADGTIFDVEVELIEGKEPKKRDD